MATQFSFLNSVSVKHAGWFAIVPSQQSIPIIFEFVCCSTELNDNTDINTY